MIGRVIVYDGSNGKIIDLDKGGDNMWLFSSSDITTGPIVQGSTIRFDNNPQVTGQPARATNVRLYNGIVH